MERLSQRVRCIAPNLRGYGPSSSPAAVEAYRAKHLVADVVALIEAFGGRVALLAGHDWGGAVAWNLAAQRPDLMGRLLVINSPHPALFLRELRANPDQKAASGYMHFLCRPDAAALLSERDFARLWPFLTGMGAHVWLDEVMREQYRAQWRHGLEGPLNYYRASPLRPPLSSEDPVNSIVFAREAVTVTAPTTVLWGEADRALRPTLLDGLADYVPALDIVRISEATHWIIHEQPERVAHVVASLVTPPRTRP
jgi:pimeloyl-ACP methyl ester carboxylesterase